MELTLTNTVLVHSFSTAAALAVARDDIGMDRRSSVRSSRPTEGVHGRRRTSLAVRSFQFTLPTAPEEEPRPTPLCFPERDGLVPRLDTLRSDARAPALLRREECLQSLTDAPVHLCAPARCEPLVENLAV